MNDQTVIVVRTVWDKYNDNMLSQEDLALSIRMSAEDDIFSGADNEMIRKLAMIALRDVDFNEIARNLIQDQQQETENEFCK